MKLLPIAIAIAAVTPMARAEEDTLSAASHAVEYAAHVTEDKAGEFSNGVEDVGHAIAVPTKEAAHSAWGFLQDVGDGIEKNRAISSGDGLAINTSVYSLALRQAEKENTPLTTLQKERDERQYRLKRAQEETDRLNGIAKDYKEDAKNFQSNISSTLTGIAKAAKKLEGWDKAHQAKLDKFLEEHKKLGSLTAEDGNARMGDHTILSLNEAWVDLEDAIKKSPTSAKKLGLDGRLKAMDSLLSGATARIQEKENQIMESTAKINELSKVDEKQVANDEASMKRQMILGTLNNSVNNLINQAEFSKARSQLAFSHFGEIERELASSGVQSGDVKNQYKKNANALAAQYNNTPIGVYVNSQISKAMSSVCELVNNQCKDGMNASLFDFLDDTSRFKFKSPSDDSKPARKSNSSGTVTK
ncbi:MAG: hypothetical protein ACXVLQ_04750 [Bacteriovorax sp.]